MVSVITGPVSQSAVAITSLDRHATVYLFDKPEKKN